MTEPSAHPTPPGAPVIRVSAVLAIDGDGRLLVVRKRGTQMWMQPGGKPEPGETPAETLARELHEELGLHLDPAALEPLGVYTTAAANEAGTTLIADVFRAEITEPVRAAAEIDAVRWMLPTELAAEHAAGRLAPLISEHMLALMPAAASSAASTAAAPAPAPAPAAPAPEGTPPLLLP